jgi:hypothetical protein
MRAHGNDGRLGKRFAIVIGLAATGVMALGAQTAPAASDVVKYNTKVTIQLLASQPHHHENIRGWVQSESRKCERGRRVVLFELRPGADRKVGTARSEHRSGPRRGEWLIRAREQFRDDTLYAKVSREEHDEFVCGGDRSELA